MVRTARRIALAGLLAVLLLLGLAEGRRTDGAAPTDLTGAPAALVAADGGGGHAVAPRLATTLAVVAAALVLVLPTARPTPAVGPTRARLRHQRWWAPPPGRAPPLPSSR